MEFKKRYPRTPQRGLTPRQAQVLEVLVESQRQRGYAPSMREIGDIINLKSPSSVKHQLEVLEAKGYIRRDRYTPRAIELINPEADVPQRLRKSGDSASSKPRYVPLVGRNAAGQPILAEEAVDGLYPLPREIVGDGEIFMLKVAGDSMIGVGINDADWVVVRRQPSAENGEIVAAQIDDEATVKTLTVTDGRAWLTPANPAYEPLEAIKAHILGRVVAVIRKL
ncbi:MAG: transcriptional repressor LexA [Bifidobacteriaceae bacterium]|jgi:repressor LexA|nr:transcriptional repressor LexA [Bifidobacteriaceae bacterium]